jgi:hypothetical protein
VDKSARKTGHFHVFVPNNRAVVGLPVCTANKRKTEKDLACLILFDLSTLLKHILKPLHFIKSKAFFVFFFVFQACCFHSKFVKSFLCCLILLNIFSLNFKWSNVNGGEGQTSVCLPKLENEKLNQKASRKRKFVGPPRKKPLIDDCIFGKHARVSQIPSES